MELLNANQLWVLVVIATLTIVAYVWRPNRAETSAVVRRPPQEGKTFRARGVPLAWDQTRLASFLTDQDDSVSPHIWSLTREINGQCRTATVTFQNIPPPLQKYSPSHSWQLRAPEGSSPPQRITLDDRFDGLTTLYAPPSENHKINVIAISGLGGHAFGSFKERGGDHMWLRDSLPYDLTNNDRPMVRVLIYGYESTLLQSNSIQNLEDLATSFHTSLLALINKTTKPIVFIAHSLGGLIVKQLLTVLSRSKKDDDQRLLRAVYGITFFGVPHDGMDISSFIPMVGDYPNRSLVESLSRVNSQILGAQQRDFPTALGGEGDAEIVCFYETLESPTAQEDEMEFGR